MRSADRSHPRGDSDRFIPQPTHQSSVDTTIEQQYPIEVRTQLLEVLEGHRDRLMRRVRNNNDVCQLLDEYFHELIVLINDHRLPPHILAGVRTIVRETFDIIAELQKTSPCPKDSEGAAKWNIEAIKQVAHLMLPPTTIPHIPYEQALTHDILNFDDVKDPILRKKLRESLGPLVFPDGRCGYKGGVARTALKLYAYKRHRGEFDSKLLETELPLADKDAIVGPDEDIWEMAQEMGVDPDGIEKGTGFDEEGIRLYLNSRDYDMNQALLTRNYLFFTPAALESVLTGVIHCAGRAVTLFGVDTLRMDGRLYFLARIVNRLVIAVVRGRAKFFQIPRYNCDIQLGIYWLVLLRKSYGKPDTPQQITKIFRVAQMMGQAGNTETPKKWIESLTKEFEFFNFGLNLTIEDIARWVLTRHIALLHRWIRHTYQIPWGWELKNKDPAPITIAPDISDIPERHQRDAAKYLEHLVRVRSSVL